MDGHGPPICPNVTFREPNCVYLAPWERPNNEGVLAVHIDASSALGDGNRTISIGPYNFDPPAGGSVGYVVRDHLGTRLSEGTHWYPNVADNNILELLGIEYFLSHYVPVSGWQYLICTDSARAFRAIRATNRRGEVGNDYRTIASRICTFLDERFGNHDIIVMLVPRKVNRMADSLAATRRTAEEDSLIECEPVIR